MLNLMSLYHETAQVLETSESSSSSLKSVVYRSKFLKNKPAHIYALASEAIKWSSILSPIIEGAGLLQKEKGIRPALALLLTHDLLLTRRGIAASSTHYLRKTIERYKSRLSSEFTRARVRAGFATVDAWREHVEAEPGKKDLTSEQDGALEKASAFHPRWVRINTLKTSLEDECAKGCLQGYSRANSLTDLAQHPISESQLYVVDSHVEDLIAVPPGTDLTGTRAYKSGNIILQNKASCFPATLLDLSKDILQGDIIDACAAPGNKTTHLAALLARADCSQQKDCLQKQKKRRIFAVERDTERAKTLYNTVQKAGADHLVDILLRQDFLKLDPCDPRFANVKQILLDPSCSGSGIIGRDDGEEALERRLVLPKLITSSAPKKTNGMQQNKRKRKRDTSRKEGNGMSDHDGGDVNAEVNAIGRDSEDAVQYQSRLKRLQSFQVSMLKHAMSFPQCSRIIYSTCAVHDEENEVVVSEALNSRSGSRNGTWHPLLRERQANGMRIWNKRGNYKCCQDQMQIFLDFHTNFAAEKLCESCIRCEKGADEGTMGFFVCALERSLGLETRKDNDNIAEESKTTTEDSDWDGFDE